MTKQKHLKDMVRARMEKTGERYAAARPHVISGPLEAHDPRAASLAIGAGELKQPAPYGEIAETAALRRALELLGVRGPNGTRLSEALLFGVAGGIGAGYWVFEYKGSPYPLLSLFTRHAWDSSKRFLQEACAYLGVAADSTFKESSSAAAAEKALMETLDSGRPALVWVSRALAADNDLPPELAAAAPHVVLATAYDAATATFQVEDRALTSIPIPRADLAASRAQVRSEKHRLLLIDSPTESIDWSAAIVRGIQACVRELTDKPAHLPAMAAPNTGLPALEKLARLLADPKDKKGWQQQFPAGRPLYRGLVGLYRWTEAQGPGALRPLYAAFLREASTILGNPALAACAEQYAALGHAWTEFAQAALPAESPLLAEARTLLDRRRATSRQHGPNAGPEIAAIDTLLDEIEQEVTSHFPLTASQVQVLLADLAIRMSHIAQSERTAASALNTASPSSSA